MVDCWQARPPQWRPYHRRAANNNAFYLARARQNPGLASRGGLGDDTKGVFPIRRDLMAWKLHFLVQICQKRVSKTPLIQAGQVLIEFKMHGNMILLLISSTKGPCNWQIILVLIVLNKTSSCLLLEPVCCKKRQKSSWPVTGLGNRAEGFEWYQIGPKWAWAIPF